MRQLTLISSPARMRPFSGAHAQPKLETTVDLADWLRLDSEQLLWFADLHDRNGSGSNPLLSHYTNRILAKPFGSIRLLEAPKQRLKSLPQMRL
jgi:RNA-directed DNA polymerase